MRHLHPPRHRVDISKRQYGTIRHAISSLPHNVSQCPIRYDCYEPCPFPLNTVRAESRLFPEWNLFWCPRALEFSKIENFRKSRLKDNLWFVVVPIIYHVIGHNRKVGVWLRSSRRNIPVQKQQSSVLLTDKSMVIRSAVSAFALAEAIWFHVSDLFPTGLPEVRWCYMQLTLKKICSCRRWKRWFLNNNAPTV